MVLPLDKSLSVTPEAPRHPLAFKRLDREADLADWVATGSKAFGYSIDAKVIAPLLKCDDIQLLLAYDENAEPVATGLLFKTADVVGIHQIGVPAGYQGKGYATQMMRFLIQSAEQWQASHVVLQASAAGKPVYKKLGFVEQFLITYLQQP
jgi:GNAT superfamily N-acetyltransferase